MMRDAAGGAAASSPSAAAARTVAKSSPRAFRSPGGATPGAVAAATAEPNGPQGLDELRGEFVFWDGMWRQVVAAGPKQTTAVAVTFRPPDSAGQLPDEKWEVATVKKVFGTADFLDALQHQKAVPADSWEHAVSEHSRGVQSCMALNAASRSLGFPSGGGPGGGGGGGGGVGACGARVAGGVDDGGGGLSAGQPLGGGGAAGCGSAGNPKP